MNFLRIFYEENEPDNENILFELEEYCVPKVREYFRTRTIPIPPSFQRRITSNESSNAVQMERRTHLMNISEEGVLEQIKAIVKADLRKKEVGLKSHEYETHVNPVSFSETALLEGILTRPPIPIAQDPVSTATFLLKSAEMQKNAEILKGALQVASHRLIVTSYLTIETYYGITGIDPAANSMDHVRELNMDENDLKIFMRKRTSLANEVKSCFTLAIEKKKKWENVRKHLTRGYKIVGIMKAVGLDPRKDYDIAWSKIYDLSKAAIKNCILTFRARLCHTFGKKDTLGAIEWTWKDGENNQNYFIPAVVRPVDPSNEFLENVVQMNIQANAQRTEYSKNIQAKQIGFFRARLKEAHEELLETKKMKRSLTIHMQEIQNLKKKLQNVTKPQMGIEQQLEIIKEKIESDSKEKLKNLLKDIKFKEKVITNLKKAVGEKLGEKKCVSCDSSVGELQYDGSFICSRCDIVDYSESDSEEE